LEVVKDEERTLWLNGQGFTVLRFWNHEILTNSEGVLETIRSRCLWLAALSPLSLGPAGPQRGKGARLSRNPSQYFEFNWVSPPPFMWGAGGGRHSASQSWIIILTCWTTKRPRIAGALAVLRVCRKKSFLSFCEEQSDEEILILSVSYNVEFASLRF
jgi:hypothetical protein